MNSDRWRQINRLFEAANELAPNERKAIINEVCRQDESLREELESLLASHAEAEPLFKLLREPKRLVIGESGHIPPPEIFAPIINDWLDETLGKVKNE